MDEQNTNYSKDSSKFIEQLEQIGDVVMWDKELTPMPRETFLSEVKDATACFITLSESVDEEVLTEASDLKIITNMAVGYDNIDVVRANDHDITVTNTPDVLTETTAELGFTLMLTVADALLKRKDMCKRVNGKAGALFTFRKRCSRFDSRYIWYGRYW